VNQQLDIGNVAHSGNKKILEYGVSMFYLFIDFKVAYVTIKKGEIDFLKEFKIYQKLLGLVGTTLESVNCVVKLQNNLLQPSEASLGLRQEEPQVC
jgi:hypothetical protein